MKRAQNMRQLRWYRGPAVLRRMGAFFITKSAPALWRI
jgi:hypothetical protein